MPSACFNQHFERSLRRVQPSLTYSERLILDALFAAGADGLTRWELRRAVGLTQRGFNVVTAKMEDRRLIGRMANSNVSITFGGLRAREAR